MGRRFFNVKRRKRNAYDRYDSNREKYNRMMKAAGMTVKDLQEIFGFATPQAIYKWKNGTAMPTIDNLVILAVTLGCKIDDLLIVDMPAEGRKTA